MVVGLCVRLGPGPVLGQRQGCDQSCLYGKRTGVCGDGVRRAWGPEPGCWCRGRGTVGVSNRDRDAHERCCASCRETFTIPLIPLGLKETKDVDFSVVLKVNLKATGAGLTKWP